MFMRMESWDPGIEPKVRSGLSALQTDSIPIQSGSIETGSKLDSIHIDRVRTIVGSSAELLGFPPQPRPAIAGMQYCSDEGTQPLAVSTRRRNVSSSGRYCKPCGWADHRY